jgi:CDP-diacylglycerol---glycerol-3-phosphate 3-phosphatidyltransferase
VGRGGSFDGEHHPFHQELRLFDGRWRTGVERGVRPVGSAIRRTGLTADHLTVTGLLLGGAAAVAIGAGRLGLGLGLLIAAAVPDLLDGAVAKASGTASVRGAFFDSVVDRVTDSLVLGGLAWYLASARGGHWAVLPLALLGASTLVSYERAKAESLGLYAKGGLMERAERIIALCVGLAFSAVLLPVLWVMLALTVLTAAQRFWKVWRQAAAPVRPVRSREPRARRWEARITARREARRETTDRAGGWRPASRRRARTRP